MIKGDGLGQHEQHQPIRRIHPRVERGDATEHTHRPALKALLESVDPDIVATNEPRRIACGAPDFNITRNGVPVGHIETKDVGVNLDEMERGKGPNGAQFLRYATLPNWVLTDYLEFRWYAAGEKRLTLRVADFDAKDRLKPAADGATHLAEFLKIDFPRLPLPADRDIFFRLAAHGADLVALHLLQSPKLDQFITDFPEKGTNEVDRVVFNVGGASSSPVRTAEGGFCRMERQKDYGPLPSRMAGTETVRRHRG